MPDPDAPPAPSPPRTRRYARTGVLLVAGVLAIAFNLRAAITSLPPLFPELSARLDLSPAAVSALAALPVLAFGVFSGVAAPLSRRFGEERVLGGAVGLLAAGLILRGVAPGVLLFPGTALAGAAIALLNVLLPSLVKRRAPERAGALIGIYLLCLNAGSILASLVAIPVYNLSGGSVPLSLSVWALPGAGGRGGLAAAVEVPDAPAAGSLGRATAPKAGRGAARPAEAFSLRADLAGHRVHGVAEPDLLRGAVLASDHAPGPGSERRRRRYAAGPDRRGRGGRVAADPGPRAPGPEPAGAGRGHRGRQRGRPGRGLVRPAGRRRGLGAGARPGSGGLARPRDLLHHGPGPQSADRRVALGICAERGVPGRHHRPAAGRLPALRDRRLDRCGGSAAGHHRAAVRRRLAGRPGRHPSGRRAAGASRPASRPPGAGR